MSKAQAELTPPAALMTIAPQTLVERAIESGNIEVIGRAMEFQERYEATQARRAFTEAIAAAKAEIKPIIRDKTGHNSKKYVSFDAIARHVDPILSKHGLVYRFRTDQADGRINVTCILSHGIHHEETTLTGPPDKTGSKNDIQAIGSTLSYLQRYSLVQMLGLAAADDDDGAAAGVGRNIDAEGVETLRSKIQAVGADEARFCKAFGVETLDQFPASKLDEADAKLLKFASQKKAEAK
jgi:hypothetical protein